jgi:hypothetical protein
VDEDEDEEVALKVALFGRGSTAAALEEEELLRR